MTGHLIDSGPDAALACDGAALRTCLEVTLDALDAGRLARGGPLASGDFFAPARDLSDVLDEPTTAARDDGVGSHRALSELVGLLAAGHADPADPACAAHLHCPPLAVAVAADLAVSVLNPSLDSWDQGPSAAAAETRLIEELCDVAGYSVTGGGGFMTTGATASTVTAMFLARERAASGHRVIRILCSEQAHFSVWRAADLLGVDKDRVVAVAADECGRMRIGAARRALEDDPSAAWMVVATAGTTDLGAIDPLVELAEEARIRGAWFHIDAAYGGALLFSKRLRSRLDGIAAADSIALDAHKLGWQPAAAGVLLVADRRRMAALDHEVAYLNAADDEALGLGPLLSAPMMTTRRADAFKLLVTLRALGRDGLGDLIDRCFELAHVVACAVEAAADLELHSAPSLTTVLFRPRHPVASQRDAWCAEVRRALLLSGTAVVGRTELPGTGPGRRWLKFTLLNPHATDVQLQLLVDSVVRVTRATRPAGGER